jgi:hypothetical protein
VVMGWLLLEKEIANCVLVFMPGLGTTMNENSGEAAIFKSEIGY